MYLERVIKYDFANISLGFLHASLQSVGMKSILHEQKRAEDLA